MLQQDYLMRMFTALAIAMRESMLRAQGDEDPEGAAELLEAALDKTTEIDGALLLQDDARRTLLGAWQERKQDTILHPYLQEKIEWGLVPHVQALLLARYLRGDLDAYPPFLWK